MQSAAAVSHRARHDRRAAVLNHTREVAAPRFRACDITQCKLRPLPAGCQPGQCLGARRHRNIRLLFLPRLDARLQCHRRASAVPSRRWARVGQGRRSTRRSRGRLQVSLVVAAERSDAHGEQTCFAASHLFYRRSRWRKIVLSRLIGRGQLGGIDWTMVAGRTTWACQVPDRDGPRAACQSVGP